MTQQPRVARWNDDRHSDHDASCYVVEGTDWVSWATLADGRPNPHLGDIWVHDESGDPVEDASFAAASICLIGGPRDGDVVE